MKLNVGCGKRRLPGYLGVDVALREGVDLVAPADELPMEDGSVDEVLAVHLVEHFFEWEVPGLLAEWARVLKPGGRLVLEMPDLRRCCQNLLEGRTGKKPDQLHMWGIFGDATLQDPLMMHKSGWWFERLAPLVQQAGFSSVVAKDTEFHPAGRRIRDFRLEAIKP